MSLDLHKVIIIDEYVYEYRSFCVGPQYTHCRPRLPLFFFAGAVHHWLLIGTDLYMLPIYYQFSRYVTVTLIPRLHDTTGLTTGCIHDTASCQTGLTTSLTTGCIVYTNIQPVVKPVWQPVWQHVVSCKRGLTVIQIGHLFVCCCKHILVNIICTMYSDHSY